MTTSHEPAGAPPAHARPAPGGGPLPVVLVGAGKVAHAAHLREIRDLPGAVRLAAVVEGDPVRSAAVRAAGFPDAVHAADLDEAVRAGARAALVCTPWWTHRAVVGECLARGLPVLCEKPVSLDPAEIDELIAAERAAAVPVAAGYMKRHDPVVALFVAHCRARLARGRRLTVDIHDPNAPHQVAHLLPYDPPPFGPQPPPAEAALARALGPRADAVQREAYARGLGGSLIHQVNLVHAVLAGSGLALEGRLLHAEQWADGDSVGCRWRPSRRLAVDVAHQRLPGHRRYREVLEFTAEDSVATLTLPSPYARDESATLHVDSWDPATGLGARETRTAEPGHTGFRRQLLAWAAQLTAGGPPLPGLAEVRRDAAAVREAALRLS
ncbi:Gfo/Idh/MocA family oxidoreductase [Streptomyces sp. V4-01]|uniref:Gfo/Idh/MocA family oxidoreductase n=1 Tax=Actinacidiphila polyblastidii TaxID=3110430 RepID=A0ABU7PBV9_9ACTN|nr:Gfo/Idh/MocA family oxidoreductase [Streptomyces sp. V4-01]